MLTVFVYNHDGRLCFIFRYNVLSFFPPHAIFTHEQSIYFLICDIWKKSKFILCAILSKEYGFKKRIHKRVNGKRNKSESENT